MDNIQRTLDALGLARRAGKCLSGDYAVERAVKAGNATLVAVDLEASPATRERYRQLTARVGISYIELPGMGAAIGKEACRIAAVTDAGFTRMIVEKYRHGNV